MTKRNSSLLNMLKNAVIRLAKYMRNSWLSAFIDISVYTVVLYMVKPLLGIGNAIIIATIVARIISSLVNFNLNKALFLEKNSNHTRFFIRYYMLWLSFLIATTTITYLINHVFATNAVIAKMISDMGLGIISYQTQKHWVFSDDKTTKRGIYFRFVRFMFCLFMRGNVDIDEKVFASESVLIGHHQNFYGPFLALTWLPDTVSFWVVDHLFNFKDCFNMYYNYTFVKTVKLPRIFALILAFLCALLIPPLVRSSRSIPVYRDSKKIVKTFELSLKLLNKGEQIMIFPDVNYNDASPIMGEIYNGFTHIEKLYFQANKRHIGFTPIIIDKKSGTLTNAPTIFFSDNLFNVEKELVSDQIVNSINSGLRK